MLPSRSFPRAILTAGLMFIVQSGISVAADFPELSLPIDCKLGEDCWLINYFDHAPEKAILDYTGGTNLYDEHKGIDIAIPDIKTMIQGVDVLAVADGVVLAITYRISAVLTVMVAGLIFRNAATRFCWIMATICGRNIVICGAVPSALTSETR